MQYRSWRWTASSWGRAMSHVRYRSSRSMRHDRWWYLALKRWIHGTIQRYRPTSPSSWCNQPNRCIDDRLCPYQHQHQDEYVRNRVDRRSRARWLQRHHPRQDCQQSSARTVSFGQHRPRRPVCTRPWRQSWAPVWGSNGWRWPSCLSRKRRSPAPWGYGRSNRWCLEDWWKFRISVKIIFSRLCHFSL